ncbi:hypothetical protein C0J52_15961, partial [Blattella germanica]
ALRLKFKKVVELWLLKQKRNYLYYFDYKNIIALGASVKTFLKIHTDASDQEGNNYNNVCLRHVGPSVVQDLIKILQRSSILCVFPQETQHS